jgi:hypothetical protein
VFFAVAVMFGMMIFIWLWWFVVAPKFGLL